MSDSARTIWKFPLDLVARPEPAMPRGARVLTVQLQNGIPTVWAAVDPTAPVEPRPLVVVGTGNLLPNDAGPYIGTWQADPFVFHVFEVRNR